VSAPPSTATHSGLPTLDLQGDVLGMGTKSRETLFGASVRAAAERAADAHVARLYGADVCLDQSGNISSIGDGNLPPRENSELFGGHKESREKPD
jgi:hypothetical protein